MEDESLGEEEEEEEEGEEIRGELVDATVFKMLALRSRRDEELERPC